MGGAWVAYPTLAGGGASTVPSGLEPLPTSILYWALSGVHELAEDGLSSPCHAGSQSSSLEIWKAALCSGSPSLPMNLLRPEGSKAKEVTDPGRPLPSGLQILCL